MISVFAGSSSRGDSAPALKWGQTSLWMATNKSVLKRHTFSLKWRGVGSTYMISCKLISPNCTTLISSFITTELMDDSQSQFLFSCLVWRHHDMETRYALPALCDFHHKWPEMGIFDLSLELAWTSCWTNSQFVGDLGRRNIHMTSLTPCRFWKKAY